MRNTSFFIFVWFICYCSLLQSYGFSAHIHSPQRHKDVSDENEHIRRSVSHHDHNYEGSEFDHEAIAGGYGAAEEFDHLSEAEAKRRLGMLLTKMDLNGDKVIEPQELYDWIAKSLKRLSEEEAFDFFDDVDSNHDGKVTWDEQLADTFGEDILQLDESDNEAMLQDKRLFDAADLDGDGSLNRTEYARFIHPEDYPEMFDVIIENALTDRDTNKDGKIDLNEYLDYTYQKDVEDTISKETKFRLEYDKNQDGFLTGEEILMWVVPNNTQIAVEETKHLFAAADDDHDNVLTFDEIIENHNVFVGSEATDYGEFLENVEDLVKDEL